METQSFTNEIQNLPIFVNDKFDEEKARKYLKKYLADKDKNIFKKGRNVGNRQILRFICKKQQNLVINKLVYFGVSDDEELFLYKLRFLNHKNVEPVLYYTSTDDFYYFIIPKFVTKLKTVWIEFSQFTKYDVKKMFLEFLAGLEYLSSKNIVVGTIHEDNLAYNGKEWYISGVIQADKTGECASGKSVETSIKSRRFLLDYTKKAQHQPIDDLWQLVLMYVITYYGFNPFAPILFSRTTDTLNTGNCSKGEILRAICDGNCHDITLIGKPNDFGENNSVYNHENNENINIIEYIEKYEECICIICFSRIIEIRYLPCGHEICCIDCSKKIIPYDRCPMCRGKIESRTPLTIEYVEQLNKSRLIDFCIVSRN